MCPLDVAFLNSKGTSTDAAWAGRPLPMAVPSSQFVSLNSMEKALLDKNNNNPSLVIIMEIPQMVASTHSPQRAETVISQTHVASIVDSSSQNIKMGDQPSSRRTKCRFSWLLFSLGARGVNVAAKTLTG